MYGDVIEGAVRGAPGWVSMLSVCLLVPGVLVSAQVLIS